MYKRVLAFYVTNLAMWLPLDLLLKATRWYRRRRRSIAVAITLA